MYFFKKGSHVVCVCKLCYLPPEEVAELMEGAGLVKELLHVEQHLQVNRGKQLTMYRVWIMAKYCKPDV